MITIAADRMIRLESIVVNMLDVGERRGDALDFPLQSSAKLFCCTDLARRKDGPPDRGGGRQGVNPLDGF